jgi:hypothetical protein
MDAAVVAPCVVADWLKEVTDVVAICNVSEHVAPGAVAEQVLPVTVTADGRLLRPVRVIGLLPVLLRVTVRETAAAPCVTEPKLTGEPAVRVATEVAASTAPEMAKLAFEFAPMVEAFPLTLRATSVASRSTIEQEAAGATPEH